MSERTVKISFDLDKIGEVDFSWGTLEDLQAGKATAIRTIIQEYAEVEGLEEGEDLGEYLRSLRVSEMNELQQQMMEVIKLKQNPVGANGKNSNGGSRSTLSSKRVSRR